jgi:hypothetical protein
MKLHLADFTYTKGRYDKSDRRIIVVSKPSDSYLGVEVSDLNDPDAHAYVCYLAEKQAMDAELKAKYNIQNLTWKRFTDSKISSLEEKVVEV